MDVRATVATFVEDFLAEGPAVVAAHIADRAAASGVSIAAAYHASRDVFPHDPRHRVRWSDPGTVLFHPTARRYAGLRVQPRVAQVSRERDAFRLCCDAARERAERRQAALDQYDGGLALVEVAAVAQNVRSEHAGGARMLAHLHDELVGRCAMMIAARVGFIGYNGFANEGFDLFGNDPRPIRYALTRRHSDSLRYLTILLVNPTLT